MIYEHNIPVGYKEANCYVPAVASGDATISFPIFYAPVAVKILGVLFTPLGAVSGTATNYRTLSAVDVEDDAAGTTVLGTAFAQSSGHDLAALVPQELVALADEEVMAAGSVLTLKNALTASGVATPAGLVTVLWWPIDATPA